MVGTATAREETSGLQVHAEADQSGEGARGLRLRSWGR